MITFDGCLKNLSGILAKASDSANPKLMRTSSGSASLDWSTESMLENDEVLSVVVLYSSPGHGGVTLERGLGV